VASETHPVFRTIALQVASTWLGRILHERILQLGTIEKGLFFFIFIFYIYFFEFDISFPYM
jgi:hypothetical protein